MHQHPKVTFIRADGTERHFTAKHPDGFRVDDLTAILRAEHNACYGAGRLVVCGGRITKGKRVIVPVFGRMPCHFDRFMAALRNLEVCGIFKSHRVRYITIPSQKAA